MRKDTRITLRCTKKLPNGVLEQFEAIVLKSEKDTAKKAYEARGYNVSIS